MLTFIVPGVHFDYLCRARPLQDYRWLAEILAGMPQPERVVVCDNYDHTKEQPQIHAGTAARPFTVILTVRR